MLATIIELADYRKPRVPTTPPDSEDELITALRNWGNALGYYDTTGELLGPDPAIVRLSDCEVVEIRRRCQESLGGPYEENLE